ncbi:tetratricopeptide repeat protein [Salmonella enterica subsp. enterica]|nr:tetratricopeptide repeat protein [Salmonella enterica subsp. enterica]
MASFNPLILKMMSEGNVLYSQGKIDEAIDNSISILNELDVVYGDRYKSEEARLIMMNLYDIYFSRGDYIEAKKWASDIFKCNVPNIATSELVNLGAVCLELGENDEAYECFLKAYEKGKHRAFKEYDPKYWEFFKSKHK